MPGEHDEHQSPGKHGKRAQHGEGVASVEGQSDSLEREPVSEHTVERAVAELSLGDRMELERWRDECRSMLSEVIRG